MLPLKLFLFTTIAVLTTAQEDKEPAVRIGHGLLQGSWKISTKGRPFASFEGIPYARPPVGKNRFKVSNNHHHRILVRKIANNTCIH